MGNLYTDNLIGTVIGLSVADDWEGARREWEIVGCEVDETHSATCVCGKEGLRYVYTIANTETGETLSPIGSSCIKKFEQSDMDEELAGWQQAIKLMEEAARIGKEDYVHLHSGSCKIWEAYIQSHVNETFPYTSILLPSGFRSLDGRTLTLNESTI